MKSSSNVALKEWAILCQALQEGEQIAILRKGGVHEDGGVFRVQEKEFLLYPTFEHQNQALLRSPWKESISLSQPNPERIPISLYAEVDQVLQVIDESPLRRLSHLFAWNDNYLKIRFDFNPYDPLYLLILRVYQLPNTVEIPMRKEYAGCKSWVTLAEPISLEGATPCMDDNSFNEMERVLLTDFENL
jgi:hypothetical protein